MNIIAGLPFSNLFTIVSEDGMTGEVLSSTDTGVMSISTVGLTPECVIQNMSMTIDDADNGVFKLDMTAQQTSLLVPEVGFAEDGYKGMTNYVGTMEFTLASGNRVAEVPISVSGSGLCQA